MPDFKCFVLQIGDRVVVIFSSGEPTNEEDTLSSASRSLTDQGVTIWAVHGDRDSSNYLSGIVSQSSQMSTLNDDLEDFQKNFLMSVCSCKYSR